MNLTIRDVFPSEIYALRHRILRADLPFTEAMFPGDEFATSLHFGAVDEHGAIVGCATLMQERYHDQNAYRLRGMAVDVSAQGKGVGSALLRHIHEQPRILEYTNLLWCNARLIAIEFYKNNGWVIDSDLFDIPTAGMHYRMYRRLMDGADC